MFVSAEIIAIVLSAVGTVVTLGIGMFAGFAWCVRRIDAVDTKLTTRIDAVDAKLTTRIDAVDTKLTTRIHSVSDELRSWETTLLNRIDAVAHEVTEVKVAVARIEGPERRLLTSR